MQRVIEFLENQHGWAYTSTSEPASEPTALAALALADYGRVDAARRALDWLRSIQNADGSVGIRANHATPGWPTALAVLAWNRSQDADYAEPARRAVEWLLSISGTVSEQPEYTWHDTTIPGWPWVQGTHSWVEPTAMALLALRSAGLSQHTRARDAVRMLEDRLLPKGGANYGNTVVLGQVLLPHVEPTGLTMTALAGEGDRTGRVKTSLDYLQEAIGPHTTPASLSYALIGLAAHGREINAAKSWLVRASADALRREACCELALLALAARGGSFLN